MSRLVFAGLFTEGTTDDRFLESIVKKTLDEIAFECVGDIETELRIISIEKTGLSFVEQVLKASKEGLEKYGIMILCVHTDADAYSDSQAFNSKIIPALNALKVQSDDDYCRILVAIIPIQMIESWLLADRNLLKTEIGTLKTDTELGIHRNPETIANPKDILEEAIRIARKDFPQKRRKDLRLTELYLPIGQKLDLSKLEILDSYQKFKKSVRDAFKELNYLH